VAKPLHVEITIDAPLDELWEKSQNPDLHQRWDLRFSEISYQPREEGEPQGFTYASRLGGLVVDGTGESVGERKRADGASSSSLKFWSDHPLAIIKEGAGFWRYVPTDHGIRFYTGYDYQVRWGLAGRIIDRIGFRPWIGWATAWSFDRLRLWIEEGQTPESSLAMWMSFMSARFGLAAMWIYQGLVPKLLAPEGEVAILDGAGVPNADLVVAVIGVCEILFGLIFVFASKARWPYLVTALLMIPLAVGAWVAQPSLFGLPFNPFALNVLALALGLVGYQTLPLVPNAGRCLRKPERGEGVDL
jgi:uncharacterized membrane protein YphA (DoxX/SURF4 family)